MENESKVIPEQTNEEIKEVTTPDNEAVVENDEKEPVEAVEKPAENRCPNCQALLGEGQTFCPECGTPLKKLCQKCGAQLQEGQVFCAKCGQKADEAAGANANPAINQFNTNVAVQLAKNKRIPIIIGGACVALIVIVLLFSNVGGGIKFEKKFADMADESWCQIASDGSYMTLDTNPYDEDDEINYDAWNAISEVNTALGFPESLANKMGETRHMDGRQTEENDKVRVTWTYHPDDGLEVMYEKK